MTLKKAHRFPRRILPDTEWKEERGDRVDNPSLSGYIVAVGVELKNDRFPFLTCPIPAGVWLFERIGAITSSSSGALRR